MDEEKIFEGLKKYFKFDEFKSKLQKDAVIEICQRKHDVLVSMPTGSGKSLCYQLPAVLHSDKITIVFSPLLALMKDQIDHLIEIKIRAASLNSKIGKAERDAIIADLKSTSPNTRLLYVTPEQAATQAFKSLYNNLHHFNKLAYLVVDEAHCVSEWGHDFRPQYSKLGELRENCNVPCIALTATANAEVTKDIITSLRLAKDRKTFKTSCFRENLYYDVQYPNLIEDPFRHLRNFINDCLNTKEEEDLPKAKKSCGIIYCRTRDQTEVLMEQLNKLGIKTLCYHAGLKAQERLQFQDKWQNGDVPVICATISFGMGVDKATVRFVVHWGVPKDPASFYQESGRAGRDGKMSHCRVYYNRADSSAVDFHLKHNLAKVGSNKERRLTAEVAIKGFKKIIEYCENPTECRHRLFSNHFGEPAPKCVDKCDFCKDKKQVMATVEQFLLKGIQFSTKAASAGMDYGDLYGGGRKGAFEEYSEAGNDSDEDGNYAAFEREQQAKKASNDFIQKQFSLRKNSQEVSQDTIEKLFSKHSRVKAACSTSNKVKGLTLANRELYLTRVTDVLHQNYAQCQEEPTLDRKDIEDCAIELEYSIFSSKTNMTMYRNAMAKLISSAKQLTNDKIVHESLLTFEPKPAKRETLSDLFRNIEKDQLLKRKNSSEPKEESNPQLCFRTARQTLDDQFRAKLNRNQQVISDYFKKTADLRVENYEATPEVSSVEQSEKMGDKSNRKDLKSLFGDDESDDETRVESSKRHNERDRHHREGQHRHRHKHEEDRKRRKSSDREEDRKRRREEDNDGAETADTFADSDLLTGQAATERSSAHTDNNNSSSLAESELKTVEGNAGHKAEEGRVTKQNGEGSKRQRLKKTEIGGLVVKLLTPAYVDRRFESRDTFKMLARNISHALVDKDENEIKEYVENFLRKNEEITSQTTL